MRAKEGAEWDFQKQWAGRFAENKDKVREYWKKHRYLDEIKEIMGDNQKIYDYPEDIKVISCGGDCICFDDESFDIVFCSNALDHMPYLSKAVSEIYRVLKKGGFFVFTVELFDISKKRDEAHPHSFTAEKAHELMNAFEIIFEKTSEWIGLRNYVDGYPGAGNKELIMVMKR